MSAVASAPPIAIVGWACRYPDASSPAELWQNALARRRAFRRMPAGRLHLSDHAPAHDGDPDGIHPIRAALLRDYSFDRAAHGVPLASYEAADLAHWLALDVASEALADAGLRTDMSSFPRDRTGVIVGNTLTGEESRAHAMRLRWPYVRDVLAAELATSGLSDERVGQILERTETRYKAPFVSPGDETLAGGLANTIAGRICNHHDLHGGGYTVDGACASSLLAVITACERLAAGDLDIAVAGAVDLSLDPFELVGFDRLGALARSDMRVFDARGDGFWPGEGCGFVVLMRAADARGTGDGVHALIRGWGLSSDGAGGLTCPSAEGQGLALRNAYARAGFSADEVAYFEAHGTGTAVGDPIEVEALANLRSDEAPPAAVGSIKANLGHTKAAAGMAGLLKAAQAVQHRFIPPATGVEEPHPVFSTTEGRIYLPLSGHPWSGSGAMRAGVSAFGFGGINTHLIVEGFGASADAAPAPELLSPPQDCEVFLLSGADTAELRGTVAHLLGIAASLSTAELTDLACTLATQDAGDAGSVARAAVVAASPDELEVALEQLADWLEEGFGRRLDVEGGVFASAEGDSAHRIGLLFPGQAAPWHTDGGVWPHRFGASAALQERHPLPVPPTTASREAGDTRLAQPAIARASLIGMTVLEQFGISGELALGHGLGEILALHWAGACDEEGLIRLTTLRGQLMAERGLPGGAMACILAGRADVAGLLESQAGVTIACSNAPGEHVISGAATAVAAVLEAARGRGLAAHPLTVSHAFHSPLVSDVVEPLRGALAGIPFRRLTRRVISTVTGGELDPDTAVTDLLCRQVLSPVLFQEAILEAGDVDLWIEVGPGRGICRLASQAGPSAVISLDAGGSSLAGLCRAIGAAFVLGAPVRARALAEGRFWRPFDLVHPPRFLTNPCSTIPAAAMMTTASGTPAPAGEPALVPDDPLQTLRGRLAARLDLELSSITPELRMLSDLHLSSISVAQIVGESARALGIEAPPHATELADATVAEAAQAIMDARRRPERPQPTRVTGVQDWVRAFEIQGQPLPLDTEVPEPLSGGSVQVRIPAGPTPADARRLLAAARDALQLPAGGAFGVLQERGGGGGFARSLSLERPDMRVCVVTAPGRDLALLAEEMARTPVGYREVNIDADGERTSPALVVIPGGRLATVGELGLGEDDVILASGGARGIGGECALRLARSSGARCAMLGRCPADDPAVTQQLERMASHGVMASYYQANVCDAADVAEAVRRCEEEFGPVTALLHAAGINQPRLVAALDDDLLDETVAVKVAGLANLLAATDADRLRTLVTFGSLIHRTGLQGEAHHALANEWLTGATEEFARAHPKCRCLALEWSVWAGLGMGMSLGSLEGLERRGLTPISVDRGLKWLERLLSQPAGELPVAVVVSGRFGQPPTLRMERPQLPLTRFVESPRAHTPGVELICDATLNHERDPYLADHTLHGDAILPGVMAIEAMAQVARALAGTDVRISGMRDLRFAHPISIPEGREIKLRVACLLDDAGDVRSIVRSSTTDFAVDHVLATVELAAARFVGDVATATLMKWDESRRDLQLAPACDLYGRLLFQRGRFQRVSAYHRLEAQGCDARIAAASDGSGGIRWFEGYLSNELVLGDPGARDAMLHALQACIPHRRVLPVAAERIQLGTLDPGGAYRIEADEIVCEGDRYIFDAILLDGAGHIVEKWLGLELHAIEPMPNRQPWPVDLVAPYLERRVGELVSEGYARFAIAREAGSRDDSSRAAARMLLGRDVEIQHRPDGKPEISGGRNSISFSHAPPLCLAALAPQEVACDLQSVGGRTEEQWHDLLDDAAMGLTLQIVQQGGETLDLAATRVWGAREALRKVGDVTGTAPTLTEFQDDSWVVLSGGDGNCTILSWVSRLEGVAEPMVFTLLLSPQESPSAAEPSPPAAPLSR